MVRYARSMTCRQQVILRYFGDPDDDACGHCDNCRPGSGRPAADVRASTADGVVLKAVTIVLSGAARMKSRYGKQLLAQMLCGSKSVKITRWKLDQLSTYGLLSFLSQADVGLLIDELIRVQLLEQNDVDHRRPVVRVTSLGWDIMRGQSELESPLHLPENVLLQLGRLERIGGGETVTVPRQPDAPLAGTSPPAKETAAAANIPVESEAADGVFQRLDAAAVESIAAPSHYWTWRLLSHGFSVYECTQIRGITVTEILAHAVQAVDGGLRVEPQWFLTDEQVRLLDRKLPSGEVPQIQPELVQLYRKCRGITGPAARTG